MVEEAITYVYGAGSVSLPPERMCSMFRTVGKVLDSLGFSHEVSSTPVSAIPHEYTCSIKAKYKQLLVIHLIDLLGHYNS